MVFITDANKGRLLIPLLHRPARHRRVLHLVYPVVFLGLLVFDGFGAVHGEELGQFVAVDPDFVVAFLLGLVEDELEAEMKVGLVDVVGVFGAAVSGAAQVADDVAGLDDTAFLEGLVVGVILSQVGVVVIALAVKAADAQPPAAVLVPADGFHVAGLHGDDGGSHLAHHVVAQVLAFEAVASGDAEIVKVAVWVILRNGGETL